MCQHEAPFNALEIPSELKVLKLDSRECVEAISNLCLAPCSWLMVWRLCCALEHSWGSLWEQAGQEAGYGWSIDFLQVLEHGVSPEIIK